MPGKKNRNALMIFFRQARSFRRISKDYGAIFAADIFGRQKDIVRILSLIPKSKFYNGENFNSKLTVLCESLNGKRINTHLSAYLLKKELKLALEYRFTKELHLSKDQSGPLMDEFEWIFDPIYFVEIARGKPKFNLTCGPLENLKKPLL